MPSHYTAAWRNPTEDEYDFQGEYVIGNPGEFYGYGPSPAAALRALTAKLREIGT